MRLLLLAILAGLAAITALPEPSLAGKAELEGVVIVNRHSLRTPIGNPDDWDYYPNMSNDTWPSFGKGLAEGDLTEQGKRASKAMGKFYGSLFQQEGLVEKGACPSKSQVYVHADNTQRTVLTAKKMAKGMFPGCGIKVSHLQIPKPDTSGSVDPLFDPVDAGICTEDAAANRKAVNAAIGNTAKLVKTYATALSGLQDVLDCCKPTVCQQLKVSGTCTLTALDPDEQIEGASEVPENIIMEYGTGLPASKVGWGRAESEELISQINGPHAHVFWGANANPYTSKLNGSNLLSRIRKQLKSAKKKDGQIVSLFVAHDNNILNIAGLIDAEWTLTSYPLNEVPPGAGIAFELWKKANGKRFVRIVVRAQSLSQLRNVTTLAAGGTEPDSVDLTEQVCGRNKCPYNRMMKKLNKGVLKDCVAKQS